MDTTTFGATGSNVFARLNAVASDLTAIAKQEVNAGAGGRYSAFAVDDIYSNLRPLFAKHGIVIVPTVVNVEYGTITSSKGAAGVSAHVLVDYTIYGADGDYVTMRFAAEGHDYQDKATNKAVQQAFKYGLIQLFQISTGEVDPDAAILPDVTETSTLTPAELRVKAVKDAAWHHTNHEMPHEERVAEAKALVAQVEEVWGGPPKNKGQVEEMVAYMDQLVSTEE